MNRTAQLALVAILLMVCGCSKPSQAQPSATSGTPDAAQASKSAQAIADSSQTAPAPQAAAKITAAVADSCFSASTESKEQDRIDFAETFKEGLSEHGVTDLTWRTIGDNHEYLIIGSPAPSWSPQIQRVAQEWSSEWRRDWFKPKLQKVVCDAGFSKVMIVVMVPKPSGGGDFHAIYKAYVTKRGFVPISATD